MIFGFFSYQLFFSELISSYLNSIPTPMLLFTLVVEREETKWLRYASSPSKHALLVTHLIKIGVMASHKLGAYGLPTIDNDVA